jgi:hypothetical protein
MSTNQDREYIQYLKGYWKIITFHALFCPSAGQAMVCISLI